MIVVVDYGRIPVDDQHHVLRREIDRYEGLGYHVDQLGLDGLPAH
jgi:hypothetical protein